MMSGKTFARSTIAAAVLAAVATGYAQFGAFGVQNAQATAITAPAPTAAQVTVPLGGKSATDFSGIVSLYGPAVVNIDVTAKAEQVPTSNSPQGMSPDDPFYDFFQRFGIPVPNGPNAGPNGPQPNQ
ncbi:MAG TPA: hypothetical protein VFX01_07620, partial [Methylophilaceae bacterium]|nr:hypothetical protein [Methylophilaceae bacterium]